ncbi:hypothetical protein [Rhizobium sp. YS-1r]|uniref:hypothetical protein n=1 Tax=Rhizobium sp. YS-1r TaxID=1532558 RepID=UPI00050DF2AC|nr:hypothetical protein [Rhizobium sp. YS-1r]KGE00979.1 hypothetical protein JL39_07485 [Rhizobium sp. YS-1r]
MKSHATLSQEITILESEFAPHEQSGLSLSGGDVVRIRKRLTLLGKLARNFEQELAIYRLIDAGRIQASTIERTTLDIAADLILAAEGNVIRPDFGKKK